MPNHIEDCWVNFEGGNVDSKSDNLEASAVRFDDNPL